MVIHAPDQQRRRRDRVVDAAMYLVAFAFSAVSLAITWHLYAPWLRVVAVVVGLVTLVSLRWRRTHPAAVGIGVGAISLVMPTASGANLAAMFNAAIRAGGGALAVIAGLLLAWAFASPLIDPIDGGYWVNAVACLLLSGVVLGWGLFVRARRELVQSLRAQGDRAARRPAKPSGGGSPGRCTMCSLIGSMMLSVHAGALGLQHDAPAEEIAEAASVIRESAKSALEELRGVIGVLREDGAHRPRRRQPAADARRSRSSRRRVSGSRDEVTPRSNWATRSRPGGDQGEPGIALAQEAWGMPASTRPEQQ